MLILERFALEAQMLFSFFAVFFGQVDAARGSEEMVERLIEQNLNLEDKLRDASEQIDDCEALSAMNNEMLELANKDSRKLREDGDMARSEASQLKVRITELQQTIADSTVTLHKFRDLTRQLQASLIHPNIFFIFFFKNLSSTSTLMPRNFDSNENGKCLPWKSGNIDVENVKNFSNDKNLSNFSTKIVFLK